MNDVPWRFCVLLPNEKKQKLITNKLRETGFHASNWYEPASIYFDKKKIEHSDTLENSKIFSKRILNLWIDEKTDEEYIRKSCKLINNYLN